MVNHNLKSSVIKTVGNAKLKMKNEKLRTGLRQNFSFCIFNF